MDLVTKTIPVSGMHCSACETRITKAINKLKGISQIRASYQENLVEVSFDSSICSLDDIKEVIVRAGYEITPVKSSSLGSMLIIFIAILGLGQFSGNFDMSAKLQSNVTYSLLFIIGIFTSLHCVGMCGGIMLSQSLNNGSAGRYAVMPALSYNLGRLLSYTLLGGIVGAIGSVISLSLGFMSGVTIFAGLFMVLMGINIAGFTIGRKILNLIRLPLPKINLSKPKTPFLVGLFNGFMPCGPLQTMQLYALSTGNALEGAATMFIFALGTIPLMLSFGSISAFLSKNSTAKLLKFSGIFIIALGLIMTNRGLSLAGFSLPFSQYASQNITGNNNVIKAELRDGIQVVNITADNRGYTPNVIFVQKGVPLKWIVNGQQINSCNNEIIVPALDIRKKLTAGENIIEFTPQADELTFSCWMGMLTGVIKVVDDVKSVDISKANVAVPPSSGCCGAGAGGGGCCGSSSASAGIYGDIAKVPTDRLIKKAEIRNSSQTAYFKGIGNELEPLIIVIQRDMSAKIILDLTNFDNPVGKWEVFDYKNKNTITAFQGKKGVNEVTLNVTEDCSLGLYKDRKIIAIIEVVENTDKIDLEKVRDKYLR
ncbi:urease accessory protein UreH domain-containing protein [Dendrosporobacter sp. 1207_IL3150]|uniref:urease accessory protein UreH domain-containing protein n=1 Tax=Dendrosporobacter sp. 1207_IL3150 TaxID=3084054 RepID=UPI002FDB02FC